MDADYIKPSLFSFSDPFADASKDDKGGAHGENFIHIRIQQRNGRKTLTTVQGVSSLYDLKKIVKACKKVISSISCGWFSLLCLVFPPLTSR